jgi:hypothetical protein
MTDKGMEVQKAAVQKPSMGELNKLLSNTGHLLYIEGCGGTAQI